jgi:hypothetical protein
MIKFVSSFIILTIVRKFLNDNLPNPQIGSIKFFIGTIRKLSKYGSTPVILFIQMKIGEIGWISSKKPTLIFARGATIFLLPNAVKIHPVVIEMPRLLLNPANHSKPYF